MKDCCCTPRECECDQEGMSLDQTSAVSLRLNQLDLPLSEYSFANIYLFREKHQYAFHDHGSTAFIRGVTYDGESHLLPLVDMAHAAPQLREALLQEMNPGDWLYPVPERWLDLFPEDRYERSYRDADSDYIYETSRMASMAGRKLHKKRNLIKQFEEGYNHRVLSLGEADSAEVLGVLDRWQEDLGAPAEDTDYASCREALTLSPRLPLEGLVVEVEGLPGRGTAGFLIYEDLPSGVRVIHFAKALKDVKGLYPFLFREGARRTELPWINLEQDLGIEALGRNKRSYQPHHQERKYRIRRR